jgi:hypothetical protein
MATKPILVDLDFGNAGRISGLLDGVSPQDASTVAQLNAAIEGLAWKASVRVATQANTTIASPGATVDGITMAMNDRVLVRAQSTQSENGIYIWNGSAVPMTRAPDASTAKELEQAVVTVEEGTSAGASFRQTTLNFTLGSGNVVWSSFGTGAPSATETTAGIAELATQAETDTGTDDLRIVTPLKLANYSGRARRFPQTFGDGSATSYVILHNLNTLDVVVSIYETGGNQRMVEAEIRRTSVNSVTILTNVAPALNSLRAVVEA